MDMREQGHQLGPLRRPPLWKGEEGSRRGRGGGAPRRPRQPHREHGAELALQRRPDWSEAARSDPGIPPSVCAGEQPQD